MKKLASMLVLFGLILAACGGNSPTAATVDGTVITVDDVDSLIASDESVVDKPTFAQFLGAAIQLEILFAAAEENYGIVVSDEDGAAEADAIYEENAIDQTREEFLDQAGISEALFLELARQQVVDAEIRLVLEDSLEPSESDLEQARMQAELNLAEVCVSHILVDTEEEALGILVRLDEGDDFGELAIELSTDTGSGANGGDLGCSSPSGYVDPFAEATMTAEIDEPTGPVESQFGFHVILVNDRTEADPADLPSDDELAAQIVPILITGEVDSWFNEAVAVAVVVVEEEYGTWSAGPPPGVTPPA